MKKNYLLLILFFPLFIFSQDIICRKSYGGTHTDYLFDAQPTSDYGYILKGSSLSNKTGNKKDNYDGDLIIGSGNNRKKDIVGNDLKTLQSL